MKKTYRPRLTREDLAFILDDMDNRDFNYNKKLFKVRFELKQKLQKGFDKLSPSNNSKENTETKK